MGIIPENWKSKTETFINNAISKTSKQTKQIKDYLDKNIPETKEKIRLCVDKYKPKIKQNISTFTEKLKEKTTETKEMIINNMENKKNDKIISHKILMMGGRRAGKSTILSSILHVLREQSPGNLCTVHDMTDYTKEDDEYPGDSSIPTLDSKRLEVSNFMKKHNNKDYFLVDMEPTNGKNSYILRVDSGQSCIDLEFVDVSGEWMRRNSKEFNQLKQEVMTSDVFVIAIDTPYLMQNDEDVNSVYNRTQEITDVIEAMEVDKNNEADRRLIIFCPVKCEKWINNGEADLVNEKVKLAYMGLINKWVKFSNVNMFIMPIQTVGGLESYKLTPAKTFFKTAEEKGSGTSCCEDEYTGILIDKDGNTIDPDKVDRIEDDERWIFDYTSIPLSWYKSNGKGCKPVYCEQPGFHILKFLVEKEENAIKLKADNEKIKLEKRGPLLSWLTTLFIPTFGKYLPVWRELINEMDNLGLIKENGDGFERITRIVEKNNN